MVSVMARDMARIMRPRRLMMRQRIMVLIMMQRCALQHTAEHCITLQHTNKRHSPATRSSATLKRIATYCNIPMMGRRIMVLLMMQRLPLPSLMIYVYPRRD